MKKLISALLVIMMMLPVVCYAEGIDLSSLTFDELKQLQSAIIQEMQSRDEFKSVWVPMGVYAVGEDIPAGVYSFSSNNIAMIEIYKGDPSDFSNYESSYSLDGVEEKVAKYEIKDGYIIKISFNSVLFETYTGLGF